MQPINVLKKNAHNCCMSLILIILTLHMCEVSAKCTPKITHMDVEHNSDNITLSCDTGCLLFDLDACPVRQWYGGEKDDLLLYNNVSRFAAIYAEGTGNLATTSTMIMKIMSYKADRDIGIIYTCSCGFFSFKQYLDPGFFTTTPAPPTPAPPTPAPPTPAPPTPAPIPPYWVIKEDAAYYGQSLTLSCHINDCCNKQAGWMIISSSRAILKHIENVDAYSNKAGEKYHATMNENTSELTINNLSQKDIDANYICSYGVLLSFNNLLFDRENLNLITSDSPSSSFNYYMFMAIIATLLKY